MKNRTNATRGLVAIDPGTRFCTFTKNKIQCGLKAQGFWTRYDKRTTREEPLCSGHAFTLGLLTSPQNPLYEEVSK